MSAVVELISLLDLTLYNSTGYLLVAAGVAISIRFMGYPDLTVDGSFTGGAALYAVAVHAGWPAVIALAVAWLGGLAAGATTAFVNRNLGIGKIISSILVMLAIITLAPYLTHGATVGLLHEDTWIQRLREWDTALTRRYLGEGVPALHVGFTVVSFVVCGALATIHYRVSVSRLGVQARYLGSATSPGLLTLRQRTYLMYAGLALGNGLVALGGAIEADRKGGFSLNMGGGVILVGLACLVLGESIMKMRLRRDNLRAHEYFLACFLGVTVYSLVLQLLLLAGLTFVDVRLTSVLFLLVLLAVAAKRHPNTARLF